MDGFAVWSRKELLEIRHTWRRFVLPALVLVVAVMSPVLARITPELLRSVASDDPAVIIQLPEPTAVDAVRQWSQSLEQLVLLAVVIISAGLVSGDLKDGAAQLMLVKPVTRPAFVLAKVAVLAGFLLVVTVIGALVCALCTRFVFGEAPIGSIAEVTAVWLAFAVTMICVMTLVSVLVPSQVVAAGIGIGLIFVLSILGLWGPANDFSPVGLLNLDPIATGNLPRLAVPLVSAFAIAAIALFAAIARFRRLTIR